MRDKTIVTVNEEIQKALSQVSAKEEVGRTLHEYGVEHLEDVLELRMTHLIEADMTLIQVHQLMQRAVEHLEENLRHDPEKWEHLRGKS